MYWCTKISIDFRIFARKTYCAAAQVNFAVNTFAPLLTINKLCACGLLCVSVCACVPVGVSVYIFEFAIIKALKASPVHRKPVIAISDIL